jgi:hypothetical protein
MVEIEKRSILKWRSMESFMQLVFKIKITFRHLTAINREKFRNSRIPKLLKNIEGTNSGINGGKVLNAR